MSSSTGPTPLIEFAQHVERARATRSIDIQKASFRDLLAAWAGYCDGTDLPPPELTRAIAARYDDEPDKDASVAILLLARRYRELARRGQQLLFLQPWSPTWADIEPLLDELRAARLDGQAEHRALN